MAVLTPRSCATSRTHTAGVAGSNPAAPTKNSLQRLRRWRCRFSGGACIGGAFVLSSASMKKRMTNRNQSRTRVTVSLPSDLVRRLDGQSRAQGASRSGVAERWLRAGERQASLFSLEQELERYYAQPIEAEETGLSAALGKAARETAAEGDRGRRPRGRSR